MLTAQQSSFGYYPCLRKDFPYPVDADGKYMYPLAQINCNELPPLENYPRSGYLQFYIATNDVYGINFDDPHDQVNFRVLYFSNDEVKDCITDFTFLKDALEYEYKPVNKPHGLTFSLHNEYFGMLDARFEMSVCKSSKKFWAGTLQLQRNWKIMCGITLKRTVIKWVAMLSSPRRIRGKM